MLFNKIYTGLGASLSLRLQNGGLINSNLANIDTPGFKATKLEFQDILTAIIEKGGPQDLDTTHGSHFNINGLLSGASGQFEGRTVKQEGSSAGLDGNTVDLDKEMASMAKNSIMYNASAKIIKKKLSLLKYAVQDGGAM